MRNLGERILERERERERILERERECRLECLKPNARNRNGEEESHSLAQCEWECVEARTS